MVLAEQIVTAMQRGTANTRWRDLADLFLLARAHAVLGDDLERAIAEVAKFRQVPLVSIAELLEGFATVAQNRWRTWRRGQHLDGRLPEAFATVLGLVVPFADAAIRRDVALKAWSPAAAAWMEMDAIATPSKARDV